MKSREQSGIFRQRSLSRTRIGLQTKNRTPDQRESGSGLRRSSIYHPRPLRQLTHPSGDLCSVEFSDHGFCPPSSDRCLRGCHKGARRGPALPVCLLSQSTYGILYQLRLPRGRVVKAAAWTSRQGCRDVYEMMIPRNTQPKLWTCFIASPRLRGSALACFLSISSSSAASCHCERCND